jgi:3-deoxy-D-manno-octulosonic-acid transferase
MDQAAHPEEAEVTINLQSYLSLKRDLDKRTTKLQAWKKGLDHIEIFLSFLHDQEEDLIEEHMERFNEEFDGAQLYVGNSGRVRISIDPTADAED